MRKIRALTNTDRRKSSIFIKRHDLLPARFPALWAVTFTWPGWPCHLNHGQDAHATSTMGKMPMPPHHGQDAHATSSWLGWPCHLNHGQDAHATSTMGKMP